ncbi:MAG TPA: M20/M25/M40 family metallo-hydrolase [Terriglobales bacterium]|nr:M20/M25/M40 family metallo-hydrolase [Terriglobales bacterium]
MNAFELTRALVDIESVTGNERVVGEFLFAHLSGLAARTGGAVSRMEVPNYAPNVVAQWGEPRVTLSTHMDTVPPFFASREDDEHIWGRGACDAKGIMAAMIVAAERLLAEGTRNFGLLFVVREERGSQGAKEAARHRNHSRFLINGEPTENKLALGTKGALRFELTAHGKLAHSAYPELGDSAIEKLLDVLEEIRGITLPEDPLLGKETLNIGTISGGQAPNVIADKAQAELLFRTVFDAQPLRDAVAAAAAGRAEVREMLYSPAVRLEGFDGLPATIVSYTTDIPSFDGTWGRPFLIGPGSIHLAHTAEERIPKRELTDAVEIYERMVKKLSVGEAEA